MCHASLDPRYQTREIEARLSHASAPCSGVDGAAAAGPIAIWARHGLGKAWRVLSLAAGMTAKIGSAWARETATVRGGH